MRVRGLAVLASALWLLASACGYSSSLRLPPGRQSVGVEVFTNDSPLPVLERALYRSLDTNVARMVSAPLKAPSSADVVVRGQIIDYFRLAGVFGKQSELVESGVTLQVRAWLYDRMTAEQIGDPIVVRREVRYAIGIGAAEEGALELALETLSQELVLDLFSQANYDLSFGARPRLGPLDEPRLPSEALAE